MNVSIITEPAQEPVTLLEMKGHVRVTVEHDDWYLEALIRAARRQAEAITRRAFVKRTLRLFADGFEEWPDGVIRLPYPKLISLTSIKYLDTAGVQQTFSSTKYVVDPYAEPARIALKPSEGAWPSTYDTLNAVEIEYTAGYGDESSETPEHVRQAVMMLAAHLYEHRESVITGTIINEMPQGVMALLSSERVWG